MKEYDTKLRDTMRWEGMEERKRMSFVDDEKFTSDGMEEVGEPAESVELNSKVETPAKKLATRFFDLVQSGETPGMAARTLGTSLKEMEASNLVKEEMNKLMHYSFPPEVRKEMVRRGLNLVFLKNISSLDKDYIKLALDAAKQIGADPDVGLNAPPSGGVTIDLGSLADLLSAPGVGERKGEKVLDNEEKG